MYAEKCKIYMNEKSQPYLFSEKTNVLVNEKTMYNEPAKLFQLALQTDILKQAYESMYLFMFDTAGHFLSFSEVAHGGQRATDMPVREICQAALLANASSVAVMHNHPGGNLEPSNPDIECTELLRTALMIIGIDLMDHIIVGRTGYTSMVQAGYLPEIAEN